MKIKWVFNIVIITIIIKNNLYNNIVMKMIQEKKI